MSAGLFLPEVPFAEADFRRAIDARRWRRGERNTRFGRSVIQGFGSFATRRISRGEPVLVREPLRGNFPVNHSDQSNTARAPNRCGLFALRDIEAGEEITEDYRFLPYFEQAIPLLPHRLERATEAEYRVFLRAQGFKLPALHPPELAAGVLSHPWGPLPCGPR